MHPQIALFVKVELHKMLDVGFIRPIDYLEWVSNIVPIGKTIGGIHICIDFRDLNKTCLIDDFPLVNIDMIVDLIAGHEMISLMGGFSSYNQIKIVVEDQQKTTFTTPWGTFFYQVIPFRLKNEGVVYHREMATIFHDLVHEIMEDYVDDLLGKSKTWKGHIAFIRKIFERLEKYKLRLNPKKCVFKVTSSKLLGFIVSHRETKVDPTKVKAIMDMTPPKTLKKFRSLQGKIQSI